MVHGIAVPNTPTHLKQRVLVIREVTRANSDDFSFTDSVQQLALQHLACIMHACCLHQLLCPWLQVVAVLALPCQAVLLPCQASLASCTEAAVLCHVELPYVWPSTYNMHLARARHRGGVWLGLCSASMSAAETMKNCLLCTRARLTSLG